ncbi:hypothetical protein BGZ98_009294 [Dissophora globulifera]|uniref:Uncharacterized protein n=1 Tax=Dissophora globulifera TaxID=979702 RepID=A0A9P6V0I1_9FUNG|nr:hypothetical protein BGZ98_009294 [Dissophora globulifera]KAG0329356.1 hypothetical protein BGZ99_002362 [Dissophora globulifera]
MTDHTLDTPAVEAAVETTTTTPAIETSASATVIATANEPKVEELSKDEQKAKILKQVEFYFSDSNLPQDKFMSELIKKSAEGYVNISRIASFKRMRDYKDMELIVEALRESQELLEVNESGDKVRRKTPIVPGKDHFQRSIYAKGLGEETPSTQLELEQYFAGLGEVKQVRMRRNAETNEFKGSVFVEYATQEDANKIASSALQYKGKDLLVMSKAAYCEMKAKELGLDPNEIRTRSHNKGFSDKKRPREEEKPETVDDLKNKVIKLTGLASGENSGIKDLKESLKEHFRLGYVHWAKETNVIEVQIRSEDIDAPKAVADLQSKGFEFNGAKPEFSVASDEEVAAFFDEKKAWETQMASRDSNRGGRGGRRGGRGRGGRGGHDRKKIRTRDD